MVYVCKLTKQAIHSKRTMEVSVGDVVMPGDIVKDIATVNKKETIVLGPGLRRESDTVFAYKAGILKKTSPAVYYVDSYQKR